VTQLHFGTNRFVAVPYRTADAHDIAELPQAFPINTIVSDDSTQRVARKILASLQVEIAAETMS
jgi:hypothetical protein